jgi:hypothetical protein
VPVGAFAMSAGSQAKARAVAEVFAAGMRAESESSHTHDVRDGNLDACRSASDDRFPAKGCNAPLRVELTKIDPRRESRAGCEDRNAIDDCAKWSVEAVSSSKELDVVETPLVVAKLVTFCKDGNIGGCIWARRDAELFETRTGKLLVDYQWIDERACSLGEPTSCVMLGQRREEEGKPEEALRLYELACSSKGVGCGHLADLLEAGHGKADEKQRKQWIADARAKACQTSSGECDRYADLYKSGLRARGDFPLMQSAVKRCSDSMKRSDKSADGCVFAAAGHALGIGVPRDISKAKQAYAEWCAGTLATQTSRGRTCELPKKWQ